MQISATRHSSGVSTGRTTGFGYSFTSINMDRDASCTRCFGRRRRTRSGQRGLEDGHLGGGKARRRQFRAGLDQPSPPQRIWPRARRQARAARDGTPPRRLRSPLRLLMVRRRPSQCQRSKALRRVSPRRPRCVAFSMPDEPKTPSLAAPQPARATVPHNITNGISCRGLITQSLPRSRFKAGLDGTRSGRLLDHARFVQM